MDSRFATIYTDELNSFNIIAEIPGLMADEVALIGGHF
jgi:hypothetical protein